MKNISLIKKISNLSVFTFLSLLAVITADITVTIIGKSIQVPVRKEMKISQKKKSEDKKKLLIDYKELFNINIFSAAILNPDFFSTGPKKNTIDRSTAEPASAQPEKPSVLPIDVTKYELHGTMVATPREYSSATILNRNNSKYEIYGMKEYNRFIDGDHEIIDITRDSVEVKTADGSVFIKAVEKKEQKAPDRGSRKRNAKEPRGKGPPTADDEGITRISENRYVIDQRLYQSLTNNMSSLMSLQRQISFIPKLDKENNPIGFEIRRITPGSLFQKIGLKRGDTVNSVNGKVLNDMSLEEAFGLLNEMKGETNINLGLNRNNKTSTIGYEVR